MHSFVRKDNLHIDVAIKVQIKQDELTQSSKKKGRLECHKLSPGSQQQKVPTQLSVWNKNLKNPKIKTKPKKEAASEPPIQAKYDSQDLFAATLFAQQLLKKTVWEIWATWLFYSRYYRILTTSAFTLGIRRLSIKKLGNGKQHNHY